MGARAAKRIEQRELARKVDADAAADLRDLGSDEAGRPS